MLCWVRGGSAGLVAWDSPCGVQRAGLIVLLSGPMGGFRVCGSGFLGRRWTEMLLAQLAVVDIPLCDEFPTTGLWCCGYYIYTRR